MNNNPIRHIIPLLLVFIIITAVCITAKQWLATQGINHEVVLVGNIVLFGVSLMAYFVNLRSVRSANPQSSVRAMYGSFMIKFFIVAIAAFIYIMMTKKNVNLAGLMVCAGLYIIYSILETQALLRLSRERKNA